MPTVAFAQNKEQKTAQHREWNDTNVPGVSRESSAWTSDPAPLSNRPAEATDLLPRLLLLLRACQKRLLEEPTVTAACGSATSGRGAGRSPGGGVLCARGPSYVSCSTSSSPLAVFSLLGGEWWVASARAMATLIRTYRMYARWRRSLRRLSAPVPAWSTSGMSSIEAIIPKNGKGNSLRKTAWVVGVVLVGVCVGVGGWGGGG